MMIGRARHSNGFAVLERKLHNGSGEGLGLRGPLKKNNGHKNVIKTRQSQAAPQTPGRERRRKKKLHTHTHAQTQRRAYTINFSPDPKAYKYVAMSGG